MGGIDERTPLRKAEGGGPPYMFMTNPNRLYRKQIHQFQCLICLTFLLLFLTAVAVTLLQSVEDDIDDNNPDNSSSIEPLLTLSWPLADKGEGKWTGDVSKDAISNALSSAQLSLAAKDKLEEKMVGLPPDTPSYKHQKSIRTSLRATYLARTGYMMDVATKDVLRNTGVEVNKKSIGRTSAIQNALLAQDVCGNEIVKPPCLSKPYRSVDGTCNNLNNADTWGVAMHAFRRALPPDYADGVSEPRKATDGSDLPSAREVSVTVHRPEYRGDDEFTLMLAVWGQFLDHDITATALSQGKDGSTISCCGKAPSEMHPECFPVSVNPSDPFFKNISCLEFVRSAPAPMCSLGPREQLNQASSYIDGSVIYGSTDELMSSLRSYESGQLRMTVTADGRTLLPISTDPKDGCNTEEQNAKGRFCFASGDARANENIHLTTLHLIMARQHNSIASQLAAINSGWDDETIFQESKKIVAAQMQHITYSEFLPVLLGDTIMNKLELTSDKAGFNGKYDPTTEATASNNFATAAFRFAHTLLPGVMKNMSDNEEIELHQILFDPYKLYSPGYLDRTVVGAMNTALERMDNYFNKELTEKLFKQPSKPCGLDLVSLNIQRGRDHGLPGYPAWREHCGLTRPSTFDDLKGYVDPDSLLRMSSLYKTVDDIDLYTGALSEFPTKDGILGPTFTCLIGDQFKRLKVGDRFWYETSEQPQAFSAAQLDEIRKTSLAGIICNTADAIDVVRYQVMKNLSPDNQQVPCRQIPQPDLTAWSNAYAVKKGVSEPKSAALFPLSATMGLHVTKTSITSDDGSNWSGQPPLNISMSVFNGPSLGPTHLLPPTIQWTSTSVIVSNTTVSITGSYSATSYAFGKPGLFNFTMKQMSGKFSLDADLLWNNTDISIVLQNGATFSTSLFFSSKTPKNISFNISPTQFVNVPGPGMKKNSSSFGVSGKGPRSAVIVAGNYSLDKTIFYWPGNLTITLPISTIAKPSLQNVNISETLSDAGGVSAAGASRTLFNITGGSIIEDFTDGSKKTLWNGILPVSIPLVGPTGTPSPTKWSAIVTITETVPSIKGTFSVPTFIHGFGFNVSWTTGKFDFALNPLFNTSFDSVVQPGYKYNAKIFLSPVAPKTPTIWNDLVSVDSKANSMEEFLSDSLDAVDSVIPITIILQGLYSPDKTVFNWLGQGIISVKNITKLNESAEKQKKMLNSPIISPPVWSKTSFGGTVTGGYVSIKSSGIFSSESTVWSGTLPIAIPVKYLSGNFSSFLFSLGVHWSGDLVGDTVLGKFSLPQFTGEWFPFPSVQWVNGSFSVNILPLWNTTLQDVLLPGANYYSKILLQGIKTPVTNSAQSQSEGAVGTDLPAPIILKGTYSPDKTIFYWSGSFIISFSSGVTGVGKISLPTSSVTNSMKSFFDNSPGLSSQLSADKMFGPTVPFVAGPSRVLFNITGGSIIEDFTDGSEKLLWNGIIPVSIPLVGPTGTPSPTTWSAVVTITETVPSIKGIFSVPTFIHGIGFNVSWTTGKFDFSLNPLFNSSFDSVVQPGYKYNAKIFLSPVAPKTPTILNVLESGYKANQVEEFLSDSLDAVDSVIPITIILQGLYSPDKTVFNWLGQGIISVKNITKLNANAEKQKKMLSSPIIGPPIMFKTSFTGNVTGGHVSIKSGEFFNSESNVWSGTLPVAIPVKYLSGNFSSFLFSLGVHWSGDLIGDTVEGQFSLPQFTGNWFPFPSVQWVNGSFSFKVLPLGVTTLQGLFSPGANYYSKILLQGIKTPILNSVQYLSEEAASGDLPAPIILNGTYSPDKTIFYWSGNFIISFRLGVTGVGSISLPTVNNPVGLLSQPLASTISGPTVPSAAVASKMLFSITGGSIIEDFNDGSKKSLWNGILPASIPLVSSTGTPSPTKWSAVVTITETVPSIKGTFSVPSFINGIGFNVSWTTGKFDFSVNPLFNSSFDSVIQPGYKYNAKIFLSPVTPKKIDSDPISWNDLSGDNSKANQMKEFLSESLDAVDSVIPITIILQGLYSPDKTVFNWLGQGIINVKNITKANENAKKQKMMLNIPIAPRLQLSKTVFAGTVTGGHVGLKSGGFFNFEDTVWSGTLPVAIPVKYFTGIFSSSLFSHGVYWSGDLLGNTIEGKFSLPQFSGDWFPFASVQLENGSFSLNFLPVANTSIPDIFLPGAKYYSKISLQGIKPPETSSSVPNLPLEGFSTDLPAPITLKGTYSPDKSIFYWSGNFIIKFRPDVSDESSVFLPGIIKSSKKGFILAKSAGLSSQLSGLNLAVKDFGTKSKSLGAIVSSGNVNINIDNETNINLWSGSTPFNIPVSQIHSLNSYNYCLPWSGSLSGSVFKGTFSFPNISNNGTELEVNWYNGEFQLDVLPLWFASLDGALIPGSKYCSNIVFQGSSKTFNQTNTSTKPVNLGTSLPAAIILKGNYSVDETLFYWNGQMIISFKNASAESSKLKSPLKIDDVTSKPPKPTKAPKPVKASISLTVTSGNAFAGLDGGNISQLWNGDFPLQLTLDSIMEANAYTPSAQVSWSGTPSKTNLEGTFSLPINVVNGSVTLTKNWIGNFSFQFVPKWSGDLGPLVDPTRTYNCRVLFEEFAKKSILLGSSGGLQATPDTPDQCNIIVIGTFFQQPFYCLAFPFMCTDGTIFTWNGEVIMTFVLPPTPATPMSPVSLFSSELKKLSDVNNPVKKVIGKVISGSLMGGLSGGSKTVLWSGSIPTKIPFPVFWAPGTDDSSKDDEKIYGHGAIWSGSVFGMTVQGTFSLPQYVGNGDAVRWWNGDFSVQVISLWESGLGDLITPGLKFNSRVIFRDLRNATDLLESSSPSQIEVDSAYKAPLVLLGSYSDDRKLFNWSGQFIIAFYNVPDVNIFSY